MRNVIVTIYTFSQVIELLTIAHRIVLKAFFADYNDGAQSSNGQFR